MSRDQVDPLTVHLVQKTLVLVYLCGMHVLQTNSVVAVSVSGEASDTAILRPEGPVISQANQFFDVEGNINGLFASYSVADFDTANFGLVGTVNDITSATLHIWHDVDPTFSAPGALNFYLTEDTSTSLNDDISNPPISSLFFDDLSLPDGLGLQLDTKHLVLGSAAYTPNSSGTMESYALDVSAVEGYLINQLNNSAPL